MAGLQNLHLDAAGRTGGSSGSRNLAPSSRRRCLNVDSDDGSDSKVNQPNWRHLPLKKRCNVRDVGQGSRGEIKDIGGSGRVGEVGGSSDVRNDLYKDEKNRQQLARLTEVERRLDGKVDALNQLRANRMKEQGTSRSGSRSRGYSSLERKSSLTEVERKLDGKVDALNQLRVNRMKEQGTSRSGSRSRGYSSVERKSSLPSAGVGNSSQSYRSLDGERCKPKSDIPTYEEVKDITITRSRLVKWFMEPFFEDLIVGCFVRVGIGMRFEQRVYRLCIVRNVDASDPEKQYTLDNKMTYKYLNCEWGSQSSSARWQMARISDAPPLEDEYNQWKKEVERTSGRMPTKHEVAKKKEEIKKTRSFVYSAETVKHMLQEKKSAIIRPLNIAVEKERLRREMEVAKDRNDASQVEKIKARLEELEAMRRAQDSGNSRAHRLAEMNKKNRVENLKNASEFKPKYTNLKSVEAGSEFDPFSRRWTRPTNYYFARSDNKANDDASKTVQKNQGSKTGFMATDDPFEASLDAGKLVDTSARANQEKDLKMLHNFDLSISLNTLQKFGGSQGVSAGAMARRQKIEATIGVQVPKDDGRSHKTVLSISEYKRRKGVP